jgi:BirA family biotin operon repressor/biotin-[acetyl-CoA-carboxylase] ligase
MKLIELETTPSTSLYLTQLCDRPGAAVEEFTVVTTDRQTAGRGQRGTAWEAEPGKNLTFSFVCYPRFIDAPHAFVLSELLALAIKETLDDYADGFSIKWANDIYHRQDKICGTLIENVLEGTRVARSICGIGLNINQELFLSDAPNPISLRQITGDTHEPAHIMADVMARFEAGYARLQTEGLAAEAPQVASRYAAALFRRDGFHPFADANGTFRARIREVKPDGCLVLEDETGTLRSYYFKEVRFLL